jgi:hypothetical protein
MNYLSKAIPGWQVVWLAPVNRYILFREPAFSMFKDLATNASPEEAAKRLTENQKVGFSEALEIAHETDRNIRNLLAEGKQNPGVTEKEGSSALEDLSAMDFEGHNYRIYDKRIRFRYANPWIKSIIHPFIAHLEVQDEEDAAIRFALYPEKDTLMLRINDRKELRWDAKATGFFKGSVFLQLINVLYETNDTDWFGVFHASAVAFGNQGVLISAPQGGGKSTLAALLTASGFDFVADDFVPVSIDKQEICSFPTALTVKKGALKVLSSYYPELRGKETTYNSFLKKEMLFLPPPGEQIPWKGKVKALLFPEYNPETDCSLEKADPVSVMNDFIREAWIADTEMAASAFLDWFFAVPCYRLTYSHNQKAIESVKKAMRE